MMDPFARRHPFIILLYYIVALVTLLIFGHPVLYAITAVLMFMNRLLHIGFQKSMRLFLFSLCTCLLCIVINPLCNHRGVTLVYMLGDMRITKEAILYGGHMALLLLGSLFMFSCFSHYMTAQNIMSLAGRIFPSFSMLFTMILRAVPKVQRDYQKMTELNGNCPRVWSSLLSVEMEDSVERSIAAKQKGYGEYRRTHYFQRKMQWQDWFLLFWLCVMIGYLVWIVSKGGLNVRYFPSIQIADLGWWEYVMISMYMSIPVLLRGKEECKWFLWKQKISDSIILNKSSQL